MVSTEVKVGEVRLLRNELGVQVVSSLSLETSKAGRGVLHLLTSCHSLMMNILPKYDWIWRQGGEKSTEKRNPHPCSFLALTCTPAPPIPSQTGGARLWLPPAEAPDHVVLTSCPLGGSHVGSLSHTLLTYKTGSHLAPTLYGYHNNIY